MFMIIFIWALRPKLEMMQHILPYTPLDGKTPCDLDLIIKRV